MISELGLVYFLERTEERNVLRVYLVGAYTDILRLRQLMDLKTSDIPLLMNAFRDPPVARRRRRLYVRRARASPLDLARP